MHIPLTALSIAFLGGLAIALQATLNTVTGKGIGAITTGLWVNAAGGLISIIVLLFLYSKSTLTLTSVRPFLPMLIAAGAIGIGVITAVAFALPKTGLATGLAIIILGQMVFAVIFDATGLTGIRIPIDMRRILGLIIMTTAIWLLLPRMT